MTRVMFFVGLCLLIQHQGFAQLASYEKSLNGHDSHPEYNVEDSDDQITRLKKQQINAALIALEFIRRRVLAGEEGIGSLSDVQKRLLEAQLSFHASEDEKTIMLKKSLTTAKDIEKSMVERFKNGLGRRDDALLATFFRIGIEVQILEFQKE